MNILIACEESQRVCTEFRKKGHDAFSCDIIDCSGGHPEWHIKTDVFNVINKEYVVFKTEDGKGHAFKKWDMMIAFPPCTNLCVSGARWFPEKRENGEQEKSILFFLSLLNANCEKIVVENPIGIISGSYITEHFPEISFKYHLPIKPTQIIHPWQFGENYEKSTCLWIKGLKPLVPLIIEKPELEYFEWVDKKTGKTKRQNQWYKDLWHLPTEQRRKERSKTFIGIAKAMAEQWG